MTWPCCTPRILEWAFLVCLHFWLSLSLSIYSFFLFFLPDAFFSLFFFLSNFHSFNNTWKLEMQWVLHYIFVCMCPQARKAHRLRAQAIMQCGSFHISSGCFLCTAAIPWFGKSITRCTLKHTHIQNIYTPHIQAHINAHVVCRCIEHIKSNNHPLKTTHHTLTTFNLTRQCTLLRTKLTRIFVVFFFFFFHSNASLVQFSLYKNAAMFLPELWYSLWCGFSGKTIYDVWTMVRLMMIIKSISILWKKRWA